MRGGAGRSGLGVALALLVAAGPALGQDPPAPGAPGDAEEVAPELPVTLTAQLGLGGQLPEEGFARFSVELTSPDDRPEVSVRVKPEEGDEVLVTFGPTALQASTPRRLSGLVPAHRFAHVDALVIEAVDPDGVVIGRVPLTPDAAHGQLLLVLDRRGAPPTDLSQLGRGPRHRKQGWAAVTVAAAEELPSTPLGYSGISAVLLGDLDLERWTAPQAHALAGWTARGGRLIVGIEAGGARLRKSALGQALADALAPLPADGAPLAGTEVTLRELVASFGDPTSLSTLRPPFLARLAAAPSDDVLRRDDAGRPVVLRRPYGQGAVVLVGCDLWEPPFVHEPFTAALLDELAQGAEPPSPRSELLFDALKEIRQPAQVGGAFALLVIFALVAGPVTYFVLKAKDRGLLVWLVIPGLTLAFTLVVPLYRLALEDAESTVVGARLIELRAGGGCGIDTVDLLMFSGSPDAKHLAIRGADAAAHVVLPPKRFFRRRRTRALPLPGEALGGAPQEGALEFPLPVALWGTRYVTFTRSVPAPRFTGSVEIGLAPSGAQRVRVRLEVTDFGPVRDAVLVCPTRPTVSALPLEAPLRPNEPLDVTSGVGAPLGSFNPEGEGVAPEILARVLQGPLKDRVDAGGVAYLVGTVERPSPVTAGPNVRTRVFSTVVVVELPVRYAAAVPFGVAPQRTFAATIAEVDSQTVVRELRTQVDLGQAKLPKRHRVSLRVQAPSATAFAAARVEALFHGDPAGDPSWRPVPLELPRGSDRRLTLVAPLEPRAGWLSADGRLELRQRFRRPSSAADGTTALTFEAAILREPDAKDDRDE